MFCSDLSGVLTIYKNHPVGNFRHKHLIIKCPVAEEGISIKYIHISKRDLKEQKRSITSDHSAFHTEWREPFDFPTGREGFPLIYDVKDSEIVPDFHSPCFSNLSYGFSGGRVLQAACQHSGDISCVPD